MRPMLAAFILCLAVSPAVAQSTAAPSTAAPRPSVDPTAETRAYNQNSCRSNTTKRPASSTKPPAAAGAGTDAAACEPDPMVMQGAGGEGDASTRAFHQNSSRSNTSKRSLETSPTDAAKPEAPRDDPPKRED